MNQDGSKSRTKAGAGKVTLADVAALARVDRSVVSRVLNDDPRLNIRPETRARVLDAIHELDYQPNAMARSLRTQRAEALGLLIPDFANPIYAAVIAGAEAAAARHGMVLLIGSLGAGDRFDSYVRLLGTGRVDGVLLTGTDGSRDLVERLEALRVPWMLVVRRTEGARRYVILDDEHAAAMAMGHLTELGHRRIAHIAGDPRSDTATRRREGYLEAMRRAGLEVGPDDIAVGDYTYDGGAAAMARLLAAPDRPTAVFVANLASAVGALAAARQLAVSIPHELSVVAIHDLPLARYVEPPLTTVRMPVPELGELAVELLLTTRYDEPIEKVVNGEIELVVRGSTGPPPAR